MALGRLPLRKKLSGVFKFSRCFYTRSNRPSETHTRVKTSGSGGAKAESSEPAPRKSAALNQSSVKTTKGARDHHNPAAKVTNSKPPGDLHSASRNLNSNSRRSAAKVANSKPPGDLHSASRNLNSNSRRSGELLKSASISISRSSSKSLSRLRDQYERMMLKMADMSSQNGSGVAMGVGAQGDSQNFESEVFRKRSQGNEEVMDYYLHNSIQPDEWKDAQMGSRIIRHSSFL